MFNNIYQVNYIFKFNKKIVKAFAVKKHYLSTELLLDNGNRIALCEMPDDVRALVLELNTLIKE